MFERGKVTERKIPGVTDEQAKQAVAGTEQSGRFRKIESGIAELKVSVRIGLALLLSILAIQLAPLLQ